MKKKSVLVFALLKAFSWLTDLMVMQGDFTEKIKNSEENEIKIDSVETKWGKWWLFKIICVT